MMTDVRVLFVDDEQNVLDGLRRALALTADGFVEKFCLGPFEALRRLEEFAPDVVVTDMRMPDMNGLALLNEVKRRRPSAARIILSGHADEELQLRSTGVAHQCLSKPCHADMLRACIERACKLRRTLAEPALLSYLGGIESLPSCPALVAEINAEIGREEPSIRRIGEIVARDPGLSAKLLKLVNSAFFGLPRTISDPAEAAALVGLQRIQSLASLMAAFSVMPAPMGTEREMDRLWAHATECSLVAKRIAEWEDASPHVAAACFAAGLMHDVGQLVFLSKGPRKFETVERVVGREPEARDRVERVVFGCTHAQAGAFLLGLWGLPDAVVEAVALHGDPAAWGPVGGNITPTIALAAAELVLGGPTSEHTVHVEDALLAAGWGDRLAMWRRALQPEGASA
jgi:HD-like signal output (HDOD) protein